MANWQRNQLKNKTNGRWLLCSEDAKVRVQRRWVSFRDTQTLVSGFNMRVFTLLLRNWLNIGKFEFSKFDRLITAIQSKWAVLLKWLMLSLVTVGFIFLEEIEPCQFEIQNFPVTLKFREVLNSGHGRFQFAACRVMFYPRSINISLAEPRHIF